MNDDYIRSDWTHKDELGQKLQIISELSQVKYQKNYSTIKTVFAVGLTLFDKKVLEIGQLEIDGFKQKFKDKLTNSENQLLKPSDSDVQEESDINSFNIPRTVLNQSSALSDYKIMLLLAYLVNYPECENQDVISDIWFNSKSEVYSECLSLLNQIVDHGTNWMLRNYNGDFNDFVQLVCEEQMDITIDVKEVSEVKASLTIEEYEAIIRKKEESINKLKLKIQKIKHIGI